MQPDSPHSLLALATQLLHAGRTTEAIDAHERLLAVQPDLPDSWYNLAFLQHRARHFDAALESYRQALDRGVSSPEEVHVNRAVILANHLARSDDAEREFRAALECNPRYVPALVNLANIHEQRGQRQQALAVYEAALALEPMQALALARLPNLRAITSAADPLVARLRQAIARPGASAAERADLGFGLGKALDDAAAYDEAFAAYAAANDASRASGGGVHYDRVSQERFVDHLICAFQDTPPEFALETGRKSPVFICGMFRSGSTLIEQIMARHPRVTAGGEIDLLQALVSQYLPAHLSETSKPIGDDKLRRIREAYMGGVATMFPDADVLTDKRPDNFLYIGLIKRLFPDAKIIHTRRDPLDNCLSVYFLHLSHSMPYALDLLDTAHWYCQYRRLMAHWKSLYPDDIQDLDYDRLVIDPRPQIEAVLKHCGLNWDDACLDFHQGHSIVMTPSNWQVRQPLYQRSSGRWRHYQRHLTELRRALGDLAEPSAG